MKQFVISLLAILIAFVGVSGLAVAGSASNSGVVVAAPVAEAPAVKKEKKSIGQRIGNFFDRLGAKMVSGDYNIPLLILRSCLS